jgi:hypothetical protein
MNRLGKLYLAPDSGATHSVRRYNLETNYWNTRILETLGKSR